MNPETIASAGRPLIDLTGVCLQEHPEDGIDRRCIRPLGHDPVHVHQPVPIRTTAGLEWECSSCDLALVILDAGPAAAYAGPREPYSPT